MTTTDLRTISMLLCSPLGLPPAEQLTTPLSTEEVNWLGMQLHTKLRQQLTMLLDTDPQTITQQLDVDPAMASRIARLIGRAGNVAFDQTTITGSGIQIITRRESTYPAALTTTLQNARPMYVFVAGTTKHFPDQYYTIADSFDQSNPMGCAEVLLTKHRETPVTYVLDLDHPITELLLAHPEVRICATTAKPLQLLIRHKHYRTAIMRGSLAIVSLTHPTGTTVYAPHKQLWLGFSAHIIRPGNDTWAIYTMPSEVIKAAFHQNRSTTAVTLDPNYAYIIPLEMVRQEHIAALFEARATQETVVQATSENETDGFEPLLHVQLVIESPQSKSEIDTTENQRTSLIFGSAALPSKRKKRSKTENSLQRTLFDQAEQSTEFFSW